MGEDITIHEFAHSIHLLGFAQVCLVNFSSFSASNFLLRFTQDSILSSALFTTQLRSNSFCPISYQFGKYFLSAGRKLLGLLSLRYDQLHRVFCRGGSNTVIFIIVIQNMLQVPMRNLLAATLLSLPKAIYLKDPHIVPYPLAILKCSNAYTSWTCAAFFA